MTVIADPVKSQALDQELSILLAMGAIEGVDPFGNPEAFNILPHTKKDRWVSSHIGSEGTQVFEVFGYQGGHWQYRVLRFCLSLFPRVFT